MKPDFSTYLRETEMSKNIIDRVDEIFELYKSIFTEDIQDIFIEEWVDSEGNKSYYSLHFYSEKLDHEIANFLLNDNIFIVPFSNNVDDIRIERTNYNFNHPATDASKLVINMTLSGGTNNCELRATKQNCDQLVLILKKYYLKNFFL